MGFVQLITFSQELILYTQKIINRALILRNEPEREESTTIDNNCCGEMFHNDDIGVSVLNRNIAIARREGHWNWKVKVRSAQIVNGGR